MKRIVLRRVYVTVLIALVLGLDVAAYFVAHNPNLHPDMDTLWIMTGLLSIYGLIAAWIAAREI
jgi:tellurite resistance protein TehA-like permease